MDVSLLLSAVSTGSPCGDNLEYNADFLQLARDVEGKPERTMGDAVQAALPPQWPLIQQASTALLQRSKDLRITHYLVQSEIAMNGIMGLESSLSLVLELLRQYWPNLHPQLDADDDNDPTVRINALSAIACATNLRLLGDSSLTHSPIYGSVSIRAAMSASGLLPLSNEPLTADALAAALRSSDSAQLRTTNFALKQAHWTAEAIESFVSEQVGSAQGVDLSALKTVLKNALHILSDYGSDDIAAGASESLAVPASASLPVSTAPMTTVEIASRDEVLRCLEHILNYYARHEPSSPLPLLLNRAKSLVYADFAAIVRNLIPEGVSQLKTLCGPDDD